MTWSLDRSTWAKRYQSIPDPALSTLRVKIDFLKSRAIKFDLAADGIASFECEPGGSYFMAIFDMIKSEGYVALRRLDQPA